MKKLSRKLAESVVNSYLTQCFNKGVYGNPEAFEYQQYLEGMKWFKENYDCSSEYYKGL